MLLYAGLVLLQALLPAPPSPEPSLADSAVAEQALSAWRTIGRARLATWGGITAAGSGEWRVDSTWAGVADAAAEAYDLEPVLRGVLGLAHATRSRELLDEVSGFYLAYLARFTRVGDVQRLAVPFARKSRSLPQGEAGARTLLWQDRAGAPAVPSECALCNAQALHPAARLVRLIATLPAADRTATMREFLVEYGPLLVHEHLLRLAFGTEWNTDVVAGLNRRRVPGWEQLNGGFHPTGPRFHVALHDTDLWLIATAAELLEAFRLDSTLLPSAAARDSLLRLVRAGTTRLRESTQLHGGPVPCTGPACTTQRLGYFEGDFDAHPDMAYAGYAERAFPTVSDRAPPTGGSWDVSHVHRLPVLLRSLWDARRATRVGFPDAGVLRLTTAQYLQRAFQGDLAHPQFNNYFDGGNGWYRARYGGRPDWGYPPSEGCDSRTENRPCLARGAVLGWGLLGFADPAIPELGRALFRLAMGATPDARAFRARTYVVHGDGFVWANPADAPGPRSILLLELAGEYLDGAHAD